MDTPRSFVPASSEATHPSPDGCTDPLLSHQARPYPGPWPQQTTTQTVGPKQMSPEQSYPQQSRRDANRPEPGYSQEKSIHPTGSGGRMASHDSRIPLLGFSIRSLIAGWRWELVTWIMGSIAFAVIIILFVLFYNKPLREWKSAIQISTMVAALSQVAQSALMVSVAACIGQLKWVWLQRERRAIEMKRFDEASRGPEGSAMLLLDLMWRKPRPYLVALGALVTIVMLGFATFAQQAVTTPVRPVPRVNDANISRAVIYAPPRQGSLSFLSAGNPTINSGSPGFGYGSSGTVDLYMAAAINAGLFDSSQSLNDVTGSCPTSQCSWEPYATLAICASAPENVSSNITDQGSRNSSGDIQFSIPALGDYLPETYSKGVTFWMEALYLGGQTPPSNTSAQSPPDIAEVFVLFTSPCSGSESSYGNNLTDWTAFRATLGLCLQTLNSTYIDGSIRTTVLETYPDIKWQQTSVAGSEGVYCGQHNGSSDRYCIYSLESLAAQIASAFNGSASLIPGGDNYYSSVSTGVFAMQILGSDPTACNNDSDVGMTGFWKRMNTTALALTNAIRTGQNSTNVTGTSWTSEQFIEVDFRWLAVPAVLYIGVTFLLFATAWTAEQSESPLWKSSPLVLLRCTRLDDHVASEKEAEEDAKGCTLHLQRSDNKGWQLVDSASGKYASSP